MAASHTTTLTLMASLAANSWVPPVAVPKLLDTDLPRIGHRIKVGEDEIHAILDVEAPKGGYTKSGRLTILYEPHVAYRCASGAVRAKLVAAGLAYPKWGEKPYPKDSYPRFMAAYAIDPEVAIKACSLGRGQVLGENWAACGYASPQDMFATLAYGGEAAHLDCMVRFLIANHLDDDLREHRWVSLARGYNGPQHAKHNYAGRLKDRYEWWAKRPDTPWSPGYVNGTLVEPAPAAVPAQPAPAVPAPPPVVVAQPTPAVVASKPPPVVARPAQAPFPGTVSGSITTPAVPSKPSLWRRLAAWIDNKLWVG